MLSGKVANLVLHSNAELVVAVVLRSACVRLDQAWCSRCRVFAQTAAAKVRMVNILLFTVSRILILSLY